LAAGAALGLVAPVRAASLMETPLQNRGRIAR
jgi:hypothetical protein